MLHCFFFLDFLSHWLYPAHRFNPGQPEPLLHPSEAVPTGPVPAALAAPLVQYRLQDRHPVQQNNVTQHGEWGLWWHMSPTLLNIKLIHLTGFVFLSVFQSHRCSRQSSPVHAEMYTHTHILLQLSTPCVTHRTSGSTCIWPFTYFSAHWFTGFVSLQRHEMCSVVFTLTDSGSYGYKPLFSWFNQILYSPIYTYHTVPFVLQL